MIKNSFTFKAADGTKRAAIVEGPSGGPCVVMCHGLWSSMSSASMVALSDALNAAGIITLRFDFKGHGDSGGSTDTLTISDGLEDLEEAWRQLVTRNDVDLGQLGLYGNSWGASIVGMFGAQNPLCKGVVMSCPTADFKEKYRAKAAKYFNMSDSDAIAKWKSEDLISVYDTPDRKLCYAYYESAKSNSLVHFVDQMECPVLLIHGKHDMTTPYTDSERIYALLKSEKALEILDTDHSFTDEASAHKRIELTVTFFKKIFGIK